MRYLSEHFRLETMGLALGLTLSLANGCSDNSPTLSVITPLPDSRDVDIDGHETSFGHASSRDLRDPNWTERAFAHLGFANELLLAGDRSHFFLYVDNQFRIQFERLLFENNWFRFTRVVPPAHDPIIVDSDPEIDVAMPRGRSSTRFVRLSPDMTGPF